MNQSPGHHPLPQRIVTHPIKLLRRIVSSQRWIAFCLSLLACIAGFSTPRPAVAQTNAQSADQPGDKSSIMQRQIPWTLSTIKGTPDPPLPYRATRVFANVELDRPTDVWWAPSAQKWIATQNKGRLVTFADDPFGETTTEPFLDLSDAYGKPVQNAFSVRLHPKIETQPWCFVIVQAVPQNAEGMHLVRFRVTDPSVPTVDPTSMEILLRWDSRGHQGGSMQFGPDGMLYFSVGDGQRPYPPDAAETGQDNSDLQASIMRINVDDPTAETAYRTPADNPFVGQEGVREEIWAFGFRNPWKITFDPNSGDLLAADVGWEAREMIYRVTRGGNYGWSIMEGTQHVKRDIEPTIPITPPLFEHTHLDSRSISGGHYWQSDRIPELMGSYIYGDWMTGIVWAMKHDGDQVIWQKTLVDTPLQIIGFLLSETGEVFVLSYDGTILRLEVNVLPAEPFVLRLNPEAPKQRELTKFPRVLSQTGIFSDVANQQPSEGVTEYQINANHWADGTHSRQWIAIPGDAQIGIFEKSNWQTGDTQGRFDFPPDSVLVKTVSYFSDPNDPSTQRHLETQVLHRHIDDWRAYNYVWNDQQTEAVLQDDVAVDRQIHIKDAAAVGGQRTQTWRHSSRSECLLCHTWGVGSVHAFWPSQLNIAVQTSSGDIANQLDFLDGLGLFNEPIPRDTPIASPLNDTASLQDRSRSYLALNCATCHRALGGGTANFNFDPVQTLVENNFVDQRPAQGTFDIDDACVVKSGDPMRSVLIYRMLKSGRGHMPQFGSNVTDTKGIELLADWIESMETTAPRTTTQNTIAKINSNKITPETIIRDLDIAQHPAEDSAKDRIGQWLQSTSDAMALSLACGSPAIDDASRQLAIAMGNASDRPEIRDLFEHHLPEDQRIERLGPVIDTAALLAIEGSALRGQQLFEQAKDVNCRSCHQIASIGTNVGPDLTLIGTKQSRSDILASLVDPSQKITPEFQAQKILTFDGRILTGIVVTQDDKQLTLVDVAGKRTMIDQDDIDLMEKSPKSPMPDQLLPGVTAQQAADLLAYLAAPPAAD